MLEIEELEFAYGDIKVLKGISLRVEKGEIATLVGANGAGKTTVLKNLSRLLKPARGRMTFDGIDLRKLEPHEVVAAGIVHVPEGRRIFPEMTVLENLRAGSYLPAARALRSQNLERAFALFPRLKERASQPGGTLSGGEQQMLAIARGLMAGPRLLLLDEPSLGLAPLVVKQTFDVIRQINAAGVTVLLVEQNVNQALRLASRAYVLETGSVVLTGSGAELLRDEKVKKAYLGM